MNKIIVASVLIGATIASVAPASGGLLSPPTVGRFRWT
jgi:hypothetical protein